MPTKRAARCPHCGLTAYQAEVLGDIAVRHRLPDNHRWPGVGGVVRSLIARGMLTSDGNVTAAGFEALAHCTWYSPRVRKTLGDLA